MKDQVRTQRKDQMEELRKMECALKEEEFKPKAAVTDLERWAAALERAKHDIAYNKLTLRELEAILVKQGPHWTDVVFEERQTEVAQLRGMLASAEHAYHLQEAECENYMQSKITYPLTIPTLT